MKNNKDYYGLNIEEAEIVDKVDAYLSTGITTQRLSLESGVMAENILRLLQRKSFMDYNDGESSFSATKKLQEWLIVQNDAEKEQSGFAVTPTYQKLQSLFTYAQQNKNLVAITGSWGIGKSEAAISYAKSYPRGYQKPGVVRVEFTKDDKTPTAAYLRILGALHGETCHAHHQRGYHNAVGALLNPDDCLILDECNYLGDAMDVIRSIRDDFGVAMVVIGNPEFKATVWGKRSRFSAFASRAVNFEFPCNTIEDVEMWLAWSGILTGMNPAVRSKFVKQAIMIGTRPRSDGGIRAIKKAIDLYKGLYNNTPLTGDLLTDIVNATNGGVK